MRKREPKTAKQRWWIVDDDCEAWACWWVIVLEGIICGRVILHILAESSDNKKGEPKS